ncbi:PHA accumulation regulator DNA-binding-like protein [Candidatus Koribacter versatilis Ellin345]|uniref:PHA accumulation regulator DNA-binding-like protein n=1 Tax=Koribacter versatilis (strain Ellin345) TaxID=204669 RepID=Q1IUU4_KORVE|nr:polyhydroxyalkanoate synthesis regulator DNA-binding domain-containing protein [Candidatus Koribacter versatilis]ABF39356.1 PHA accumulation regulator DNA-binding-like protein [Candidatus Koribacter versatilis Ellin345]
MNPARVVVKKYPNRRLYDTSASAYVNLDDIARMVRNGKDVQVVDALTSEDLTRVVLTQIIVEDTKGQPTGLPLELLRQLIVASDHAGKEFIMWYLRSAFDAYQKMQGTLQSGIAGIKDVATSPVDTLRNFLRGPDRPTAPPDETEELRHRIADLESRLAKPKKRTAKKKPSKSPKKKRPNR